ncbi:ATP-binding protein [Calothrix rhizosoleniae]|uniref:ATP-binding protein n=1 Tax=Calothrix rhizosoleniae TaxID=888997 RepID=UPI000B49FB21|nr:ATP-binding protein [Calothrix rhizosoleniae]
MSITANSQISNVLFSKNLESMTSNTNSSLQNLGAELVYTQDATGRYLSFYWQQDNVPKHEEVSSPIQVLNLQQVVNDSQDSEIFVPVEQVLYLQRLQQVLTNLEPDKCRCWFSYHQYLLEFELVISPIMPKRGSAATQVLVMGRLLQVGDDTSHENLGTEQTQELDVVLRSQQNQKLVHQITKNIRRTLDLEIIWQQTVDSLGSALAPEHCIICPCPADNSTVKVAAAYQQSTANSMLGVEIDIASEPVFTQALTTLEPVFSKKPIHPLFSKYQLLVVPTCYQEKANGLIAMTMVKTCYPPNNLEMELAKEVGEQLGTAIAHATLYKQLEDARQQAEEATRRKSEFLANVSHELRTPLNGMIGFLKLILEGMAEDPEEQMQFLLEAHKSSLHLLDIINDILDISRIEAGKMELKPQSVTLNELFSDVENFSRPQAETRNLSFQMHTPDTCDEIIMYGDYQRLKQVMLNLLGNALKFTHEGGITVSADVVKKKVVFQNQEFPGMVRVRVADTGIGVSLDKQDKLFQLFSQVDGSRTRQYGGTGLGLAISQKLIEAMGGEVNFYSLGEGLGSTVTFTVLLYQQPVLVLKPENES